MTAGRAASRRAALVLGVVLAGSGCAGTGGGEGPSGVRGTVVVDAGCPPTVTATACPLVPLAARLRFVAADEGAQAVAAETAGDGTFSVELAPGSYEVRAENLTGAPYPRADPVAVDVHEGGFTEVTVRFDSGVR